MKTWGKETWNTWKAEYLKNKKFMEDCRKMGTNACKQALAKEQVLKQKGLQIGQVHRLSRSPSIHTVFSGNFELKLCFILQDLFCGKGGFTAGNMAQSKTKFRCGLVSLQKAFEKVVNPIMDARKANDITLQTCLKSVGVRHRLHSRILFTSSLNAETLYRVFR